MSKAFTLAQTAVLLALLVTTQTLMPAACCATAPVTELSLAGSYNGVVKVWQKLSYTKKLSPYQAIQQTPLMVFPPGLVELIIGHLGPEIFTITAARIQEDNKTNPAWLGSNERPRPLLSIRPAVAGKGFMWLKIYWLSQAPPTSDPSHAGASPHQHFWLEILNYGNVPPRKYSCFNSFCPTEQEYLKEFYGCKQRGEYYESCSSCSGQKQ